MAVRYSGSTQKHNRNTSVPSYAAFTICGWMRVNATPASFEAAFAIGNNGAANGAHVGNYSGTWGVSSSTNGAVAIGSAPASGDVLWMAMSLSSGNLVGYRRNRGSTDFGVQSGSVAVTGTPNEVCVGSSVYDGTDYFTGDVWNVKMWDRVLTAGELLDESYAEGVVNPLGLNAWYRMPNAAMVKDLSGLGRHFTSTTGTPTSAIEHQQLFVPRRPLKVFAPVAGGFNAGRARGSNQVIGGGAIVR